MKILNQRDYPKLKIGNSGLTVATDGCYTVCEAMISGKTVEEVVELFNRKGVYDSRGFIKHPDDAIALGFTVYSKVYADPKEICIAEVDFNPSPQKDQHFVVWLGDGDIIDPWGGVKKKNPYKVYSYRIYKPLPKEEPKEPINLELMDKNTKAVIDAIGKATGQNIEDRVNSTERDTSIKWIENAVELQNKLIACQEEKEALKVKCSNKSRELEAVGIIVGLKNTLLKILNYK